MKRLYSIIVLCLLIVGVTASAQAAGFAIYEWGSRANGMGATGVALVDDASAMAMNPAAMTRVPGTDVVAGVTAIAPKAKVEIGGVTAETKGKVYLPPHGYVSHQLNDDLWTGFGIYSRFGVGTNYDHDWAGRFNVYKASLESFTLSPGVAYKICDNLSIGAALDVMYLRFDLRKFIHPGTPGTSKGGQDWHLENSGWAWGGNISLLWEPIEKLSLGVIYRTPQRLVGDGKSKFSDGTSEDLTMRATLPGSLVVGAGYDFTDDFRMEFDVTYTNWSDYSKIEYRFGSTAALGTTTYDSHKEWKNTFRWQIGAEYDINDAWTVRAGYIYDESPIKEGFEDFMLPINSRNLFTGGLTYKSGPWTIDGAYMYLTALKRTITARSSLFIASDAHITGSHAHIGSVTIGYEF